MSKSRKNYGTISTIQYASQYFTICVQVLNYSDFHKNIFHQLIDILCKINKYSKNKILKFYK